MQLLGIHRIRTTAYHPCSNGLVERLHRQLKASLMAHLPQTHWIESLPLVLLGIRTALKEDIQHTSAELVYGTTLHLPGAFFPDSTTPDVTDTTSYVSRLKSEMNNLKATAPLSHVHSHTYVNPDLQTCTHVFVRRDTVGKKLQPPYMMAHSVC